MFKVLDAMGIPPGKIEMFGVDRMKQSGNGEAHEFAVTKVPTLIVYSGEKEIGRIVEQPRDAVELDMSRMVRISQ